MTSKSTRLKIPVSEDFLHYIWITKSFVHSELLSTSGESIKILDYGVHNHNAGPDFLNAKILLDETHWVGNIEIHTISSLWNAHGHQQDPSYDTVILHIVYEEDQNIYHKDGSKIACLELKDRIDKRLIQKAADLLQSKLWIPCEYNLTPVRPIVFNSFLEAIMVERLNYKSIKIKKIWENANRDWQSCLYILLAYSFGLKVNAEAFQYLAESLPLNIIEKNQSDILRLEALIFGQAGFLSEDWKDSYPNILKKEYAYLKNLYTLKSISKNNWRFHRLRPFNFPTIRLAQMASFFSDHANQIMHLLDFEYLNEYYQAFDVQANDYWFTHYLFDKPAGLKEKKIGQSFINQILINAVVPFLFCYGKERGQEKYVDLAIHLLIQLKAEKNNVSNSFKKLGFPCKTALESQALIQLKDNYCNQKKCLNCAIGHEILK